MKHAFVVFGISMENQKEGLASLFAIYLYAGHLETPGPLGGGWPRRPVGGAGPLLSRSVFVEHVGGL